jgi:hypothetical protein
VFASEELTISNESSSAASAAKTLKAKQAERGVGTKATVSIQTVRIQTRKPKPHEWVRVHPDADNFSIILNVVRGGAKNEDDASKIQSAVLYPVHPDLADDPSLSDDATMLREYILAITRKNTLFIWEHAVLDKENTWVDVEESTIARARSTWIRQISNMAEATYNVKTPIKAMPDPEWAKFIAGRSFDEILVEALGDKFITSVDHPIVKELLGA